MCRTGEWSILQRRSLSPSEECNFYQLMQQLQSAWPSAEEDKVEWALNKSKLFTTKSLYSFLIHRGVCVKEAENLWRVKAPMKIKVFLWQLDNDRLQTAVSLKHRGWKGSHLCVLCGRAEDVNHIFFRCSVARMVWCGARDSLGWEACPVSWEDWKVKWVNGHLKTPKRIALFLFAGLAWGLWTNRNRMAIERIFPSSPQVFCTLESPFCRDGANYSSQLTGRKWRKF